MVVLVAPAMTRLLMLGLRRAPLVAMVVSGVTRVWVGCRPMG